MIRTKVTIFCVDTITTTSYMHNMQGGKFWQEDTFDPGLTLSMTISRTLPSWLTSTSDSMSLVVALLTAERLPGKGASRVFVCNVDLWLGLRRLI